MADNTLVLPFTNFVFHSFLKFRPPVYCGNFVFKFFVNSLANFDFPRNISALVFLRVVCRLDCDEVGYKRTTAQFATQSQVANDCAGWQKASKISVFVGS